jgi:hypothetical protein
VINILNHELAVTLGDPMKGNAMATAVTYQPFVSSIKDRQQNSSAQDSTSIFLFLHPEVIFTHPEACSFKFSSFILHIQRQAEVGIALMKSMLSPFSDDV